MAEVHHSTQKGMAVNALEWCCQKLRESVRKSTSSLINVGVLVEVITCMGVCISVYSAIWPHAFLNLSYLLF